MAASACPAAVERPSASSFGFLRAGAWPCRLAWVAVQAVAAAELPPSSFRAAGRSSLSLEAAAALTLPPAEQGARPVVLARLEPVAQAPTVAAAARRWLAEPLALRVAATLEMVFRQKLALLVPAATAVSSQRRAQAVTLLQLHPAVQAGQPVAPPLPATTSTEAVAAVAGSAAAAAPLDTICSQAAAAAAHRG